ncbi:metallophosphoesterase family protein [bacterium]|nr:metallophosphoesterase family protein [bacterium]
MRIVAISDLHGSLDPVHEILTAENPDLLLCAGDWGIENEIRQSDFEAITERVFTLTIFGNHDYLDLLPLVRNQDGSPILLENGMARRYRHVQIGGISGIWAKSKKRPWYINDNEVDEAARQLQPSGVDILMTHGCPIGMADLTPIDTHGGQRCFTDAFRTVNPKVHLCGHLHRKSHYITKNERFVINVGYTKQGDYAVLESQPDRFQFEAKTIHVASD